LAASGVDAVKFQTYVSDAESSEFESFLSRLWRFRRGVESRLKYLADEYLVKSTSFENNATIIDVGANIGALSNYLTTNHGVVCICIEPEIKEITCLSENLKGKNYQAFNFALLHEKIVLKFYQKNDSSDSSLSEAENYQNVI
jgi:hypothetical protein